MNLIEITDFNGAKQYISAGAVEQITEAGASSQWHGIRSIVRLFNGKVIESQNTAYEVASMVKRAAQEPTP